MSQFTSTAYRDPATMRAASVGRARVAVGALFFVNGFAFATWV